MRKLFLTFGLLLVCNLAISNPVHSGNELNERFEDSVFEILENDFSQTLACVTIVNRHFIYNDDGEVIGWTCDSWTECDSDNELDDFESAEFPDPCLN